MYLLVGLKFSFRNLSNPFWVQTSLNCGWFCILPSGKLSYAVQYWVCSDGDGGATISLSVFLSAHSHINDKTTNNRLYHILITALHAFRLGKQSYADSSQNGCKRNFVDLRFFKCLGIVMHLQTYIKIRRHFIRINI